MKMRILACAAALAAMAVPAAAQNIEIGPGGVRVGPSYDRSERSYRDINQRQAIRIAQRNGVADAERVSRGRDNWRVAGTDMRGRDITVVIDAQSGDVVDVNRGWR